MFVNVRGRVLSGCATSGPSSLGRRKKTQWKCSALWLRASIRKHAKPHAFRTRDLRMPILGRKKKLSRRMLIMQHSHAELTKMMSLLLQSNKTLTSSRPPLFGFNSQKRGGFGCLQSSQWKMEKFRHLGRWILTPLENPSFSATRHSPVFCTKSCAFWICAQGAQNSKTNWVFPLVNIR